MKDILAGFKEFISRGNAIDLAVGVVIGAAFTSLITAIVEGLLTPLLAIPLQGISFEEWNVGGFKFGSVISALINFLLVAAALYFFVVAPLNALHKRRAAAKAAGTEPEDAPATELDVLQDIKTLLAKQAGESTK